MWLLASSSQIDLIAIFQTSPLIYVVLLALSLFSSVLWLYSLWSLRQSSFAPKDFFITLHHLLTKKEHAEALLLCHHADHPAAAILAVGLGSRERGYSAVIEKMESEGKRCGVSLWQRLSLINDVVVLAPMVGLLGTVVGLFYSFYDVNRSPDTLTALFDGLGIAVGSTVVGLAVSILSMVFYATLKFRVVRMLDVLETETLALGHLVSDS